MRNILKIKNFVEIALCSTVFEILAFLCFAIFAQKFENSKWPPFFGKIKFFLDPPTGTKCPQGREFEKIKYLDFKLITRGSLAKKT